MTTVPTFPEISGTPPPGQVTEYEKEQDRPPKAELLRREAESCRLYEPQPFQEEFHRSPIPTSVMQKANQVGGTLCGAVEVARALTGQDPHNKYPKTNGVVCC